MNISLDGNRLIILINLADCSVDVIYKCFYWYTGKYRVDIEKIDRSVITVTLTVPEHECNEENIRRLTDKIHQDLIDFKLRDIVTKETKTIRELIIAKAFSSYDNKIGEKATVQTTGYLYNNKIIIWLSSLFLQRNFDVPVKLPAGICQKFTNFMVVSN